MARMVVIYRRPADPIAFDRHYFDIHLPLARQLPGLRKFDVSTGEVLSLAGVRDCYHVATLHFDDMAAIRAAFESDIGRRCAADRQLLAGDANVQILLFGTRDV